MDTPIWSTDEAREVMALAHQEAERLNNEYIGTEHILLGLIKEDTGLAAIVLKNLGATAPNVLSQIRKISPSGPGQVRGNELPKTPSARRAIEHAKEEARRLGHDYLGTEHLLLGLLRDTDGVAVQILMIIKLKPDQVREHVLKLIAGT